MQIAKVPDQRSGVETFCSPCPSRIQKQPTKASADFRLTEQVGHNQYDMGSFIHTRSMYVVGPNAGEINQYTMDYL